MENTAGSANDDNAQGLGGFFVAGAAAPGVDNPAAPAQESRLNRMLLLAAEEGDAKQVAALLAHGASARFSEKPGGPDALCLAAEAGQIECVRLLLPHSDVARVGEHGTALHFAAYGSGRQSVSPEDAAACVECLIEHCDPKVLNSEGQTALMMAARGHSPRCVELLIKVSDVDAVRESAGSKKHNALMIAASRPWNDSLKKIVDLLAAATTDLDASDDEGHTALMMAVEATFRRDPSDPAAEPLAYASLLGRANANAKDDEGWTALDHAAARNDIRQVMALRPFTDLTSARDKTDRLELDGNDAFWSGSSIGVATNHDAWRVADYLAPFSGREDADRAFAEFGSEEMPEWAAFLRAEREAQAIHAVLISSDGRVAKDAEMDGGGNGGSQKTKTTEKSEKRTPRML